MKDPVLIIWPIPGTNNQVISASAALTMITIFFKYAQNIMELQLLIPGVSQQYVTHAAQFSTWSISCSFRITVSGETLGILGMAGE